MFTASADRFGRQEVVLEQTFSCQATEHDAYG